MPEREVRYCTTGDDVSIGYAVTGDGPLLIHIRGWLAGGVDAAPSGPTGLRERIGRGRTYVTYDQRGLGSSQRDIDEVSIATLVTDLEALVDRLQAPQFDLFGSVDGAIIGAVYAARNPERVRRLALVSSFAAGRDVGNIDSQRTFAQLCRTNWKMGRRMLAALVFPDAVSEMLRSPDVISMSGEIAAKYLEFMAAVDVTVDLRLVRAPTIIFHDPGNKSVPYPAGKIVAGLIKDSRFVTHYGNSFGGEDIAVAVRDFLDEGLDLAVPSVRDAPRTGVERDSTFRTVLFTDLVGHTEMMQRLGDDKGRDVLREHERITRETLKEYAGAEVKTMGDGFMASFGSVTKAMDCAIALQRAFAAHEGEPLHVRVGLNAGEPIEEDGDLFGSTVILASRIAAQAGAGEILIPEPLRHLLSGKSYVYSDRGETALKGFEDAARLYEVRWRE